MVRLCGGALGLLAFSIAALLGLRAGNPVDVILLRALQAMLAFCLLGLGTGWVAYRVLDEHAIRRHREMFPSEVPVEQETGAGPAGSDKQGKPPPTGGKQGAITTRQIPAGR